MKIGIKNLELWEIKRSKANIKLNDQIEKTICQYCGYLIIIDEVLGKKPVTTPVERKRSDELEEARKYRDKKKFDKAEIILKELANKDDSDIEVFCELIKNEIDRLKELNFNDIILRKMRCTMNNSRENTYLF